MKFDSLFLFLLVWSLAGPGLPAASPEAPVPRTPGQLVAALGADAAETRRRAYDEIRALLHDDVSSLGRSEGASRQIKTLVGPLLDVVSLGSPPSRQLAVRLLEELGEDLARRMGRGSGGGRILAGEILADLVDQSEAVMVQGGIREQRLATRLAAAGIDAYGEALQSSNRRKRRQGVVGLREIAGQVSHLLTAERLHARVVRLSDELLELLVEILEETLEDPDPEVRRAAVRVAEDLADVLALVLEEGSSRSRRLAADVILAVRAMLEDPDRGVQRAAERALGRLSEDG